MSVTLKITNGEDLRRLTVQDPSKFSLAQLHDTVRKLYGLNEQQFARVALKYVDDEGDLVTVSTDDELREAFLLAGKQQPAILRLQVKDAPKNDAPAAAAEEPEPAFLQHLPPWARRAWKQRHGFFHGRPHDGEHPHPHHGHGRDPRCGRKRWWRQQEAEAQAAQQQALPPTIDDARHPHTLYLTDNPYGHGQYVCDGCSLPGNGRSYHCGSCNFDLHTNCDAAREQVNPWERRRKWFALHHEALALMEQRSAEALAKAKALLEEQLKLSPHHQASPLYNLACVEAILGHAEAALKLLQDAVSAGWNDWKHTEKDEDFASLRALEAFKAIIAALKADDNEADAAPAAAPASAPASPVAAEKKEPAVVPLVPLQPAVPSAPAVVPLEPIYPTLSPVAPAAPVEPPKAPQEPAKSSSIADFDEKLRTLESMGFVDRRKNITLLVKHKGDLVAAIQALLDEALYAPGK